MKETIVKLLTATNNILLNLSLLLLRCMVGVILFIVGSGKVLGWFNGAGFKLTIHNYSSMGITSAFAYLSCFTEFIGGVLLIIGLLTRPAAFAVMINMLVATIIMLANGTFVGRAAYPFSLLISTIVILLAGPKKFSIDALFFHKSKRNID